ncbi:MAG TPA: CHASE sensor domain-containing protein, partial [Thermoanaerobaculia bacterium]
MTGFGNLSIRHKLTVIIMATSSSALLLACVAFVLHDRFDFRRRLVDSLSSLAAIIGSHSAEAILFNDAQAAGEALAALKAEPRIAWACIYRRGEVFAHYARGGGALALPLTPPAPGPRFAGDRLLLATPIVFDGERIGTIVLESDLDEIGPRLRRYVGISALVLAASSLVALLLSARLQRVISV